ncbi:MAG: SEC-C metal-binding domain-containing protein [Parahaliea sp.]
MTADSTDDLSTLLSAAGGQIYRSSNPEAFLNWMVSAGPLLAPSLAKAVDPATGPVEQFFRLFAVEIYNATPLPDHDLTRRPIPRPSRNEPCLCGSGRRYKQCCISMEGMPFAQGLNMLRYVLDQYSVKALAELPGTRVDTEAVADTAEQWLEEGDTRRALALLEPWFKGKQPIGRRHRLLFDLLMNLYLEADHPVKRKRLLERACRSDDTGMRADAYERKATILIDAGDAEGAWEAFTTAQRLNPDSPSLALLEITLLCTTGEIEQAKQRATFWLARLRRSPDATPEILDLLADCAEDPLAALDAIMMPEFLPEEVSGVAELFAAAPDPAARYTLLRHDDEAMLLPGKALQKLERQWVDLADAGKPNLTHTGHGDPGLWENSARWLPLLRREPALWQSFEVLDDLVLAVDALEAEELLFSLQLPLLDRAVALLECNLARAGSDSDVRLPWPMLENRPALRLLAHSAFLRRDIEGPGAGFVRQAELLLRLNPGDNHGVRDGLSGAYLANGMPEKTITLAEQYPEEMMCALPLNHVLALYTDKQEGKALSHLAAIADRFTVAIDMLLAKKPVQPEFSGYGIRIGGEDEAWLYRESTLALWQAGGALDWLRLAMQAAGAKGR